MNYIFESLNNYCERTTSAMLSEPINLVSNLVYIILPIVFFKRNYIKNTELKQTLTTIKYMCFAVGLGSMLFHSFAQRWSQLADVLPIIALALFTTYTIMTKILRFSNIKIILNLLLLFLLTLIFSYLFADYAWVNGSHNYFGLMFFMSYLAGHSYYNKDISSKHFISASLCFVLALFFRMIDNLICFILPIGTHFLWHVLTGLMFYQVFKFIKSNYKLVENR